MLKKSLLTFLVLCAALPAQVFADVRTEIDGIDYLLKESTMTAEVTGVDKAGSSVSIPAKVSYASKSYTVTKVSYVSSWRLETLKLPATIVEISNVARSNYNLKSIKVNSGNDVYCDIDGVLFSKDKSNLIIFPQARTGKYNIPVGTKTLAVVAFSNSKITSVSVPEGVTEIPTGCFYETVNLEKVELPQSLTKIGANAFYGTIALESIVIPSKVAEICENAFTDSAISSVKFPESELNLLANSFARCSNLTHIELPAKTNLHPLAFVDCSSLKTIAVAPEHSTLCDVNGIVYSKDKTVLVLYPAGCADTFTVPDFVNTIGSYAFAGCNTLKNVSLPDKISVIENYAFSDCTALESFTIPASVKRIGDYVFNRCTLKPLIMECDFTTTDFSFLSFDTLNDDSIVLVNEESYDKLKYYIRNLYVIGKDDIVFSDINPYACGFGFKIIPVPDVNVTDIVVAYGENAENATNTIALGSDGVYFAGNLPSNTMYTVVVNYKVDGFERTKSFTISTGKREVKIAWPTTTQTTAIIPVIVTSDRSCKPTRFGVIFDGKEYDCDGKEVAVLTGLDLSTYYTVQPYAYYGEELVKGYSESFKTLDVNYMTVLRKVGPTSIELEVSVNPGDAEILSEGFVKPGDTEVGDGTNRIELTGLNPGTTYTYYYLVETNADRSSKEYKITLPELELTTLDPKVVALGSAIVGASTNILDVETSVGFQWKKYDAPTSLKPSEAFSVVYSGSFEGYIRNLQSSSYYNVRAFYKSAKGDYIYGDWVTFDPSDFSYFEPTVRTYDNAQCSYNKASVKGYALQGSDPILEQGFQFWLAGTNKVISRVADSGVQTVLASGQVMTATLDNLLPETEYVYRAFVRTEAGIITGEEQSFVTGSDPSGVEDVIYEGVEPEIVAYYDLNGNRSDRPYNGLNIVVYSDGSSRKLIIRE